jgi:transposase InsO family protein
MLAVVFALNKFNQYVYGRPVTVHSDHKPLEAIAKKPLRNAPKRLQGMLLKIQKYDINIVYKPGPQMYLADTLSRAYISGSRSPCEEFEYVNAAKFVLMTDRIKEHIRKSMARDEVLQLLKEPILKGWPENAADVPATLVPYYSFRDELAVHDGLIYRGERLVIPKDLKPMMREAVHSSHIGVNGCLRRARESMYWPSMNADIRNYIAQCETCRSFENRQAKETLRSHPLTDRPWEKTSADLFTLNGKEYLVVCDYFSNFIEVNYLEDTKSSTIIRKLKGHFARYGIPDCMVTDNSPQFTSDNFKTFAEKWDFDIQTSSPGHQQANGLAESAVKTAKKLLRKAKQDGQDPFLALLAHRNTPSESLGTSPAQRFFGRRTRTLLPVTSELLRPQGFDPESTKERRRISQAKQAHYYNKHAKDLDALEEGDIVRMRPFQLSKKTWDKALVKRRLDDRSYEVEYNDTTYRRNRVDLKKTQEVPIDEEPEAALEA